MISCFAQLPQRLLGTTRAFSSLRSSRNPGLRGRRFDQKSPVGIPNNATKSSQKLVDRIQAKQAQFDRENELYQASRNDNSLLSPVFIPEDPGAVLTDSHPAARLLENSGLVVQRNLELGTILLGYEQANKYVIMDPAGNNVGFIAEEENRLTQLMMRQLAHTHRAFTTHVFDRYGNEILRFHRPFALINSRITAYDPVDRSSFGGTPVLLPVNEQRVIGLCQQQWHLWRRKYDLFLYKNDEGGPSTAQAAAGQERGLYDQFAYVDEPLLAWDFTLLSEDNPPRIIGSVNKNFAGFGREIFTDTGVYALRMDSASTAVDQPQYVPGPSQAQGDQSNNLEGKGDIQGVGQVAGGGRGMTLDERAVMLATAVSIDFDYFSRHSGRGGVMPFGVFGGGYSGGD